MTKRDKTRAGEVLAKKTKLYVVLILCLIIVGYILLAVLPYVGRVRVPDATRELFSMENFFGQCTQPERVMLVEYPRDAFFHRVNLISNATEEILLSSFVIDDGESTDIIVGALLAAADRGVHVRILNNAVVGQMPRRYLHALSAHENINVYLFNQFNLLEPQFINAALHCKYLIADSTFMLLGGRNMSDRYFGLDGFTGNVSFDREVLVYNTDPDFSGSINEVMAYFNAKINSNKTSLVARGSDAAQSEFIHQYQNFSDTLETFDYYSNTMGVNRITLITNGFETARKESIVAYNLMQLALNSSAVIAQSPYVALTSRNLELFAEVTTGRDFTLLTNSLASTPNLPAFSAYHVSRGRLVDAGITIYEFQSMDSNIHGKTYLFDGRLTAIGSFNLNERSIRSDTESMLIIDSEEFHEITLSAINNLRAQSIRVGEEEITTASFGKRLLYTIAGYVLYPFRFLF